MATEPYITKHQGEVSGNPFWQVNYPDWKVRGYKATICQSEASARQTLAEEKKKLGIA